MDNLERLEYNKVIAEFDGVKWDFIFNDKLTLMSDTERTIEYDKDWSMLMRVVDKIEEAGFMVDIHTKKTVISRDNKANNDSDLVEAKFGDYSKLDKTFMCVTATVRYINYLNNKTK